jgi:mycothiol synthase
MSLRARSVSGAPDLPKLLDLLVTCQQAGYVDAELRSIELRVTLRNPTFDSARLTRVLEDDAGQMVAFGLLWQGRYLGMLVHPEERGRLEDQLIDWAVEQVRHADGHGGEVINLWALCRDDDAISRERFEQRGFSLVDHEFRMVRDLHGPIPSPAVPDGFTLRSLNAASELDDWLELYRAAIGDRPAILERWRAVRRDNDYDQSLDLIAVDHTGKLAGMCYCSIPTLETSRLDVKEGRTEPIAVAEPYRRRGLGRALVLSGLHLLRARGMDQALLTMEPDNAPAHRLYESIGYQLVYQACWYTMTV